MSEGDELARQVMAFVRAFGLHRPDETPCGAPIPVSEAHALTVLAEQGPVSQNRLAAELRLTKSTVSRLVVQLEKRGWVRRRRGDADGRERQVELTAEGERSAREVARRRGERMDRLLERIPVADRASVITALATVVEAAREE
jgi:DNA-binding MarR family transcriptional regulator